MSWGSFLNVVAYRGLCDQSLIQPSQCPCCNHTIAWYDLIPVLSWLWLKGRCRNCSQLISWWYPALELTTALFLYALWHSVLSLYFPAYCILFSALLITMRTDGEHLYIIDYYTWPVACVGIFASFIRLLPISFINSLSGILLGFGMLWLIKTIFYHLKKQQGLGEGDLYLLATIGAFVGGYGCWIILFLASLFGSLYGIAVQLYYKKRDVKLPLGAFLALATMIYVLFSTYILEFINFL